MGKLLASPTLLARAPARAILIDQLESGRWRVSLWGATGTDDPPVDERETDQQTATMRATAMHWTTGLPIGCRAYGAKVRPYWVQGERAA